MDIILLHIVGESDSDYFYSPIIFTGNLTYLAIPGGDKISVFGYIPDVLDVFANVDIFSSEKISVQRRF